MTNLQSLDLVLALKVQSLILDLENLVVWFVVTYLAVNDYL